MSTTHRKDAVASNTAAVDAVLTLSSVYLTSVERLSSLNLNTARETIEDLAAATKALAGAKAGNDFSHLLSEFGQPMWEKGVTHLRSTYEIMAKTQEEMLDVIKEQFGQPSSAVAGLAGWNVMSDMFTKGVKQFTASAEENVAAAAEARSKVVAAATSNARKVM